MGKRSRRPNRTKITYKQLEARVAKASAVQERRLTRADVSAVFDSLVEEMLVALVEYEEIHIRGFGQLYRFIKSKREIVHPQTKERIVIAPHFDVNFKTGAELRRRLGFEDPKRGTKSKSGGEENSIPTDL